MGRASQGRFTCSPLRSHGRTTSSSGPCSLSGTFSRAIADILPTGSPSSASRISISPLASTGTAMTSSTLSTLTRSRASIPLSLHLNVFNSLLPLLLMGPPGLP